MKNQKVADILERMGTLLEIKGELVFKIRAYFKAAENIRNLTEDIETVKQENRLATIPGIGKALEEKIVQYLDTGQISSYQKLIKEVPETLLDIVSIPSIGPKKAKLFYEKLKIKDIGGLRRAAQAGKLEGLPGIKAKSIANILKGMQIVREGQERMNLGTATKVAEDFLAAVKTVPEVKHMSVAGSLRRGQETVGDIDILITSPVPRKVMEIFTGLPQVTSVNVQGDTKSSILTKDNVQVDLRVVEDEQFGAALLYFTGSKDFGVKLRQIAMRKKMKVSEYGVFSVVGKKERVLASKTEQACFKALGLPYIPPELREDIGADALLSGKTVPRLIGQTDIQGELHVHSTWSDGKNTIAEMADAAQRWGYKYLAISDHSPRLRVAGGVAVADLKKKKEEIDRLNAKMSGFRILFGTEVEVDMDGNLDYNNAILSGFDIVVAAVHSGFGQSKEKMTRRLLKVCQNKHVHILAHPTGRHIGKREAYDMDFKQVCRAAAEHNVYLEINAFPVRLDLSSANVFFARQQGAKFAINTDAHHVDHMEFMKFGITVARRGWLGKADVLNTLGLPQLLKAIKK